MSYLDTSFKMMKEFEGVVPWMYLDTVGVVTVACGRALFDEEDALSLPFGVAARKATLSEIEADYARVKAMKPGLVAREYRCPMSPVLDNTTMDSMLYAKIDEFDGALKSQLHGYVKAPDTAKVALLDMAYNLGVAGLLKFRMLCAAVAIGRWDVVAAQCNRRHAPDARNEWTKKLFESCIVPVTVN